MAEGVWPIAVSGMKQHSIGSSNAVKSANGGFPWSGSGFDLTRGMSSAYRGPTGTRTSLLAAQKPGSLDPGMGSSSSATPSIAKDAGTSSMPPPSVPSSALTKAGTEGSAASSQEGTSCEGSSSSKGRRSDCYAGTSNKAGQ